MAFDPVPAAAALHRIRQDRVPVAPLPAGIAPKTGAEGAAVQFALARLAGAVPPAGFKIGATGKRMQVYLGVTAPVAGSSRITASLGCCMVIVTSLGPSAIGCLFCWNHAIG